MKQNKNKIFFFTIVTLLTVFLAFSFTGCVPPVPEIIEVTGVEIADDDQSMKVDETLQLTTVVTPEDATNKAITWQSDNPDVAIVDENGLVTALKKGVANITVITEDGAFANTIKITVTKPYVPSPPTIKKYEVSFQVIDGIPAGINSRNSISIDLSGFKIEIFKDTERTIIVKTTTTDSNGAATVELPDGEYWFKVSKDGYVDYPPEATFSIERTGIPGYFKVEGADVTNMPPIPMERTYILTMAVEQTDSGTASDDTNNGPYTAGTGVTISAEAAEGYKFINWSSMAGTFDDNTSATTTFTMPASNVTVTANFAPTYNVTIADVIGGTATVVANPNSAVLEDETVTVTISSIEEGKAFSSIEVTGDVTTNSITTTEVTAGEEYTFTMPAENVTVTVNIEMTCVLPESIYSGSNSSTSEETSSLSVPLPSTSEGDLIIVIFATKADMGSVTLGDGIDGFQEITIQTGSGYPGIAAFYKIATSTETGNFECTLGNANYWFARSIKITGHRNTDPIGNSNGNMVNGSSTLDIPSINGASCSLLIAAAVNNEIAFDSSYPIEMNYKVNTSNTGKKIALEIAEEDRLNAGDTGIRTFSLFDETYSGDIAGIMFEILSPNSVYQAGK